MQNLEPNIQNYFNYDLHNKISILIVHQFWVGDKIGSPFDVNTSAACQTDNNIPHQHLSPTFCVALFQVKLSG